MKTLLNLLACLVIFTVAAFVGNAFGFFKVAALDNARDYGMSVVTWAKGGFKGSPTASLAAASTTAPGANAPAPTQAQAELSHLIKESQHRAVTKYPDLAVANTELNSRFVFRYNWLVKENSPRLQEPNWPEVLADECAEAAKVRIGTKSGGPKEVAGSKKLVASSAQ